MSEDKQPIREAFIKKLVDYMKPLMHLNEWRIFVKFDDDKPDSEQAVSCISESYLESEITFNSNFLETKYEERDGEYLLNLVAHELAHCHTAPILWAAKRNAAPAELDHIVHLNEMLTQRIANIACDQAALRAMAVRQSIYFIPEEKDGQQSEL